MNFSNKIMSFIVCTTLLLFVLGFIKFGSHEKPELLHKAKGCFTLDADQNAKIQLGENGNLYTESFSTNFRIEVIKGNYLITPDISIMYDNNIDRVIKGNKLPRFIHFDDSKMQGFDLDVLNSDFVVHFSYTSATCKFDLL
jgi:hypothetical protein